MSQLIPVNKPSDGLPSPPGSENELAHEEPVASHRFLFFNLVPSWTVSFLTHVILLVIFAIWVLQTPSEPEVSFEASSVAGEQLDTVNFDFDSLDSETNPLDSMEEMEVKEETTLTDLAPTEIETDTAMSPLVDNELFSLSATNAVGPTLAGMSGIGETSSRSGDARAANGKKFGATPESEESVELALEWLAKHQLGDGSWNFDHTIDGEGTRSRKNPGTMTAARAGATGLALMTFLGCGETHQNGKYKENVRRGLEYLTDKRGRRANGGFSFYVGDRSDEMYSHGICAIVLCEAYGMTNDTWLKGYSQGSIDYIKFAQHPQGGWRYDPKQAGDTSAVGWQLMALKSAKLGGLDVDNEVLSKAGEFLDRVSFKTGTYYGYETAPTEISRRDLGRTAIGLLCRMYMGWNKNNPSLIEGVEWIAKEGPDIGTRAFPDSVNMYYNYYATQLLKQYGGELWKPWNEKMRDFLVERQDTAGNERGSWYFANGDLGASRGGRLYCTCMSAMTLEVYYRYSPIYKDEAVEKPFDLD